MMIGVSSQSVGAIRHPLPRRQQRLLRARASGGGGGSGGAGRRTGGGGGGGGGGGDSDDGGSSFGWLCATGVTHLALRAQAAFAAKGKAPKEPEVEVPVDGEWEWMGPMATSLGFSGLLGFASGAAFKFIGRGVAIAVGLFFALLQGMVYAGVVDIKWDVVERKLDLTGDGKFDEDDLKFASRHALRILTQAVPSVGGFSAGFFAGIKLT